MILELEQKAKLTKQEHDLLLSKYDIIKTIEQTDIYFDTMDDYFKTLSSALRVRMIDDKLQLTLKIKAAQSGHTEYNYDIEVDVLEDMLKKQKLPKQLHDIADKHITLTKVSKIVTTRKVFNFSDHQVELDETNFGDVTDYEVEIESTDLNRAAKVMNSLLNENNITFSESCSKIKRYFEYKKQ